MNDERYPYTYACDYIRCFGGYGQSGAKLSRADASKIRQAIATALHMDDALLACKLADYFEANEEVLAMASTAEFISALTPRLAP